jgi:hypothetical protein
VAVSGQPNQHARLPVSSPLIVSGCTVHAPVTEKQAQRLAPLGLLADKPETLLVAWLQIERMWSDTVDRAWSYLGTRSTAA